MGRWAQAARRSRSVPAGALGAPPAPELTIPGGQANITSAYVDNVGGSVTLYQWNEEEETWVDIDFGAWAPEVVLGELGQYVTGKYYATATGNGVNYVGESVPSNEVNLDE